MVRVEAKSRERWVRMGKLITVVNKTHKPLDVVVVVAKSGRGCHVTIYEVEEI